MAHALYPVKVTRVVTSGPNAWTIYWKREFRFRPGQLVALSVAPEGPQRIYSIVSGAQDEDLGVLFNRVEDGRITPILATLRPGDPLYASAPFGTFLADESFSPRRREEVVRASRFVPVRLPARAQAQKRLVESPRKLIVPPVSVDGPAVWIANGTGVSPFLSLVRSGAARDKILIQGARTRAEFYGQEELSKTLGESYIRCCSAEEGPELFPGRLTAYLRAREWPSDRPYALCGSSGMVAEVRDILIRKGVPFRNILSEVFF